MKIQLVLLTSLKPFVKIIDASQGRWRSNVAPHHVASMRKFYETWKTITNQKEVEEVDLELSFCHFGAFSFSTGEQKQMHRTYIKCAGHALLEYEKVLEDTTELVELINIFHPPYLLRMRIKDDVMRTAFKQFRRVFHGLSFNEVEEEFNLYHMEVEVDLTLPFGNL